MDQNSAAAAAVSQTVEEKLSLTEQMLKKLHTFALNQGVDFILAVIVFVVGYMICREIKYWAKHVLSKSSVDTSAVSFLTEMIYFVCLLFVTVTALGIAGVSTTSIVAAVGGIGLAIGLAVKDNLSNVASGIFILIFRPFRVGDYIAVGSVDGTVVDILIMYTRIKTLGNQLIVVPNNMMANSVIKNYSHYDIRNLEITVDVGYDTDLRQAFKVLKNVFLESPYVVNKDNIVIFIKEMADSSIRIYTRTEVERGKYFEAQSMIYMDIKEALDKAGIDMPYPQLVVHQAQ